MTVVARSALNLWGVMRTTLSASKITRHYVVRREYLDMDKEKMNEMV